MSTTFGSVEKMLQGKKYPQNIRTLRLLTEELLRPAFEKENARLTSMGDLEDVLDELSAQSRTTKMWVNNVIKPTFPMMRFCRASHEGDWPLHIMTAEAMVAYMFAANKYNYSRYGLYYVRSMTWLGPEILDRFCQGQQSLHHTAGIYNGQWSDMFIETNWMRKGHGTGGINGMTENPQTMASWVYSMDATMTSRRCLGMMQMYKLPTRRRLKVVSTEMGMIAIASCSFGVAHRVIDPMDPVTHAAGCLINISNGQIAQTNVNVDRALEVGREQLKQFEASWPAGFYNTLSKQVLTFAERKKHLSVGASAIVDQEAIYARVIGLLVSQRDLDLHHVLATELTAYPPSMSQADGEMRDLDLHQVLSTELTTYPPSMFQADGEMRDLDLQHVLATELTTYPPSMFQADGEMRDLDLHQVLATELTAYPQSVFQADGEMWVATGKSTLKNSLKVEVSQRLITSPTAIVMDVSAVLRTVD